MAVSIIGGIFTPDGLGLIGAHGVAFFSADYTESPGLTQPGTTISRSFRGRGLVLLRKCSASFFVECVLDTQVIRRFTCKDHVYRTGTSSVLRDRVRVAVCLRTASGRFHCHRFSHTVCFGPHHRHCLRRTRPVRALPARAARPFPPSGLRNNFACVETAVANFLGLDCNIITVRVKRGCCPELPSRSRPTCFQTATSSLFAPNVPVSREFPS